MPAALPRLSKNTTRTCTANSLAGRGKGLLRLLSALYVMFFGAGENWRVWGVVMALLTVVYLVWLSEGFSQAITFGEILFLGGYIALSAVGVLVRRKRRRDA